MTRLILMRHAKSSWGNPDLPDRERPLNRRGQRAAETVGHWLRAQGILPEVMLVSDSRRTRETAEVLALDVPVEFHPELYLAEPETILSVLAEARGETVMVLGHNPGLADLAAELCADPPAHPRFAQFPTAAVLVLRFDGTGPKAIAPGKGAMQAFVTPRDLSGDGIAPAP